MLLHNLGASKRIFELIEREPKIPSKDDKLYSTDSSHDDHLTPESIKGLIEFKNVSFSYPSRPDLKVLKSFDLTIPPCTTAALVGR